MPETRREDPYTAIALLDPQAFELRGGPELVVPLYFEPDASLALRSLLSRSITPSNISQQRTFRDAVPDTEGCYGPRYDERMMQHARTVLSCLAFTFSALGSTLIQVEHNSLAWRQDGTRRLVRTTVYRGNPMYNVLDERPEEA